MVSLDEDALLCDMAETYRVYDLESLPVLTIATLACGLRGNSRIMAKVSGFTVPFDTYLLMTIVDSLRWLQWSKTEDAQKKRNRPEPIANKAIIQEKKKPKEESPVLTFSSPEEFMAARAKLLKKEVR